MDIIQGCGLCDPSSILGRGISNLSTFGASFIYELVFLIVNRIQNEKTTNRIME